MYPDLDDVSVQIACVYRHFNHYYPEISLPRIIYTCVSGVNPEIPPVMLCGDALVISLDWYLEHDGVYDRLGMPHYRSERTGIVYLGRDLGQVLYLKFLSDKHVQTTILDEMIYQGKMLLFVEALCPEISDETLLGYSKEQLAWAKSNEGDLWADIVGNQRIYSSEYELFRMFFADGPFTNEYSYDAPARLGEYVGLNIVRSYFGSHDITLQELMENNDFQGIFQDSRYKPKK